jgi:predicted nucleic acid-binding protein
LIVLDTTILSYAVGGEHHLREPARRLSTLRAGLGLFERHAELDAFDAVLGAGAMEAGAEAFVSADHAFRGIRGLRHVEPLSPAFDALLAR